MKPEARQALFCFAIIVALSLLQKNTTWFLASTILIAVFLLLCLALFKYQSLPNSKDWAKRAWLGINNAFFSFGETFILPNKKSLVSMSVQIAIPLLFLLLTFPVIMLLLDSKIPIPDSSKIFSCYCILTVFSIFITSPTYAKRLNKKLLKEESEEQLYKAEVTKRMLYILYFVFYVVGTFRDIEKLAYSCAKEPDFWTVVIVPAFMSLIAYERAFR